MPRWPGDAQRERTSFGSLSRSDLMARVRSSGNLTTEHHLAHLLRKAGISGWRRRRALLGRPDFVWNAAKVAVFTDGCFWHGHQCRRNLSPRTNVAAWKEKITRNQTRDRKVTGVLRRQGWRVVRIWECELSRNPQQCLARIRRAVLSGRPR